MERLQRELPAMFMITVEGAGEPFDGHYLTDKRASISEMLERMSHDFDPGHTTVYVAYWREMDEEEYLDTTNG